MKYKSINHWNYIPDLEGLLFFAQAVDEMLFDYALDSYKPPALNVRTLCIEALKTIDSIIQGSIRKSNIDIIVKELKTSLESDYSAKSILGPRHQQLCNSLNKQYAILSDLRVVISLLYTQFNQRKYLTRVKDNLNSVIHDPKPKELIYKLSKNLVSELINYGYHPNYIYYQTHNFFFDSTKRSTITSSNELSEFLESFDFKQKEFKVIFKASNIFLEIKDILSKYKIEVSNSYNCTSRLPFENGFVSSIKADEVFLICSKVENLDDAAARQLAEKQISTLSNIFSYYHHKENPRFSNSAIVCRLSDNYVSVLTQPTKSILKAIDTSPKYAASQMKELMEKLDLSDQTMYRFTRAIELHSVALETSAIENQLLDLWAAIEMLIQRPSDSREDRISQISNSLVPFMQVNYVKKHITDVSNDLKRWNAHETYAVLSKMIKEPSTDWYHMVALLICVKANEPLLSELMSKLDKLPLLRHRLFVLNRIFSVPNNIQKAIQDHGLRVEQQIRRIYRVRNGIIHSGDAPSYASVLVENLHKYFDTFNERVIQLEMSERKIKTISEAILETKLAVEHHISVLQKYKNDVCTKDNYLEILFAS